MAVGCFVPSIHRLESELPADFGHAVMTYLQKFPLLWQENFIIASLKIRKKLLYNILVTKSQHRCQKRGGLKNVNGDFLVLGPLTALYTEILHSPVHTQTHTLIHCYTLIHIFCFYSLSNRRQLLASLPCLFC